MKNIGRFMITSLFCFCLILPFKAEAAHHYLWNNQDYVFWMDDTSIQVGPNKDWCSFKIVVENLRTGKQDISKEPIIIYKRNSEWWLSFYHDEWQPPHTVDFYDCWWQPWGLKWLLDNGFLE